MRLVISQPKVKLANDVEGRLEKKGWEPLLRTRVRTPLFGIEKVLSNATKVITAGIEDGTNGTSRLAENLQEYGVFEYLDSIDMNTKEAEESFKAIDSEAANFMAKRMRGYLIPPRQRRNRGRLLKNKYESGV